MPYKAKINIRSLPFFVHGGVIFDLLFHVPVQLLFLFFFLPHTRCSPKMKDNDKVLEYKRSKRDMNISP